MQRFQSYLADINHLTEESSDGKTAYIHPTRKNLGVVTMVLLREVIAPTIFRNAEQEITDIELESDGEPHIRAVPNKFKYPEKGRGLQLLRAYGVGGRLPQNKTALQKSDKPSHAFDLNTLVFGDSANQDNRVLPVKAAVSYSDGLSLKPKHLCVDETFHNRAMEDGTLFDAADKKNSDNLFSRHFIKPGTLLVQVLSTRGCLLPKEGLDHLLLSIGLAGAYGGQTSTTGTNIRSHVIGVYGGRFERAISSPYLLVKALDPALDLSDPVAVSQHLHQRLASEHESSMEGSEAQAYITQLIERFEQNDSALEQQYKSAAKQVAALFDNWFGSGKK